jgi:hypothetical protein
MARSNEWQPKIESLVLLLGRKNPQDCLLLVSGGNSCGNTSEKANIDARELMVINYWRAAPFYELALLII